MNKPKILVTGATGKTGGAVAQQLLEKGWDVRAVVRKHDARSQKLQDLGAEIAVANVFDYDQVLAAMKGVDRLYFNLAFHPHIMQATTIFAIAAQKAKIEQIVSLGQWLSTPRNPSLLTRQEWLTEQLFANLPGIKFTAVNPGYFADNYLNSLITIASNLGVYPWPYGDTSNAPPSNEDIGRVAVAALMDPAKHDGKAYRPTGPELLSGADITTTISTVLDRSVMKVDMSPTMFLKALRAANYPEYMQLCVSSYIQEHRQGAFEVNAPTSHVQDVSGQAAESFETTVRRYASEPEAKRTLSNTVNEAFKFMMAGFTPVMDFERMQREQQHPMIDNPLLAMEDREWKLEHGAQFGTDERGTGTQKGSLREGFQAT